MITRRLARPLSALSSTSWTCPACTRASFVRQRLPQLQRRKLHHVERGDYEETFRRDGVPGLFSPTGYQIAWTTYQAMIIQKLNELVAGEDIKNMKVKDIVIRYARDPMNASLFNHASMAHNNSLFFQGLSTSPTKLDGIPRLKQSLITTFGSIETLRTTMLDTAAAMFGPGFVWLVWTRGQEYSRGEWRILTTYNAGTPYPEAGYRQQGQDMNNVGSFGPYSKHGVNVAKIPPGGTSLTPVLCVNTWEHVYIYDFGLPGKRKYLADWWEAIDWSVVEYHAPRESGMDRFMDGSEAPRMRY